MTSKLRFFVGISFFLFLLACNRPIAASPTPDLFATLQASTPSGISSASATDSIGAPGFGIRTPNPPSGGTAYSGKLPAPFPSDGLTGHIVFTCQLFKAQAMDQVCIMNADGSGMRRLTTEDYMRHYYPSLAPDGQSVVYSGFREQNVYEIYSLDLRNGNVDQLTDKIGVLNAPEISPDGNSITFMRGDPATGNMQIMVMDRDGGNAKVISGASGWDPTWSPDGKQILFAGGPENGVQLFVADRNGKNKRQVTHLPQIRGRSDWSPDGKSIVTYSGPSWHREVYIMNVDGTNARQLTPSGGNSQGPSFSPDGKWVTFTAYFDQYGNDFGCEIYVIRVDGTDLRRLTNNDTCDYQPRWGP